MSKIASTPSRSNEIIFVLILPAVTAILIGYRRKLPSKRPDWVSFDIGLEIQNLNTIARSMIVIPFDIALLF